MEILIISAHPDDDILGVGGTASKLISSGNDVSVLFLGEGVTGRYKEKELSSKDEIDSLRNNALEAGKIIGYKEIFFENLPDNRFDNVNLLEIVKTIEKYMHKIEPEEIFTHHHGDLNIDHQITHNAVLTASRPMDNSFLKKIFTFEVLSSTEWNNQTRNNIFIPNIYIDISKTIDEKIKAMECYNSEMRKYPHPRSNEGIKILAQKRGLEAGLKFAEAFCLIRAIDKL
jgi:LmbE family N-acetylglucosaminyl deacetylase